ncbi:MAG: hypothetical protein IT378_07710 [Sandaracinaceae bacterium]|nr:hypothetical protein [Sandaracinaceae bacterium]
MDLGGSALAGEPSIAVAPAGVTWTVARSLWAAAPAGCEGVRGQGLAGCESEPGLGALLGPDGRVLCVDAIELLSLDAGDPLAGDPSPQPNLPLSYYGVAEP